VTQYANAEPDDPNLRLKREAAVAAARRWEVLKTEDDVHDGLWPAEETRLDCLRHVP